MNILHPGQENSADHFTKLALPECEVVLVEINPALQGSQFHPATVTILAHEPRFYPGYRFFDIADYETVPNIRKFVLYKPDHIVLLDWTNEPLYQLNKIAPLTLNDETVLDYVRFFFTYVRGRHGRFIITDTADDILWREEPPPAARKAITQMLAPLHIIDRSDDGDYILEARMMFKDALLKTIITVKADGAVNLSNETLLEEGLPVLDDTFGQ